jgi:hypothetical protein
MFIPTDSFDESTAPEIKVKVLESITLSQARTSPQEDLNKHDSYNLYLLENITLELT